METLINPYCSLDDVKDVLKLARTDTAKDDELTKSINLACRWIDQRQRRDYFLHDHTTNAIKLSAYNKSIQADKIFPPFTPIISITELKEQDTVMVEDTDYVIDYDVPVIYKRFGHWVPMYMGFQDLPSQPTDSTERLLPPPAAVFIFLKGKFGYDQANAQAIPTGLPQEIRFCAMQIAAVFSGHHRKESVGLDGTKVSVVESAIPKTVLDTLGRRAPILI